MEVNKLSEHAHELLMGIGTKNAHTGRPAFFSYAAKKMK